MQPSTALHPTTPKNGRRVMPDSLGQSGGTMVGTKNYDDREIDEAILPLVNLLNEFE